MRRTLLSILLLAAGSVHAQTWMDASAGLAESYSPFPTAFARTAERALLTAAPNDGVYRREAGGPWVRTTRGIQGDGSIVAFARHGARVVAAGEHLLRSTDDGRSWDTVPSPGLPAAGVTFGPDGTLYLRVGASLYASVDDGGTWEQRSTQLDGLGLTSLPDGTLFIRGSSLRRSIDGGRTWTPTGPTSAHLPVLGPSGSTFTIAGQRLFRSTDWGVTWTDFGARPSGTIQAFVASDNWQLFVGVAGSSGVQALYGSVDGLTWTAHYSSTSAYQGVYRILPPSAVDPTVLIATQSVILQSTAPSYPPWTGIIDGFSRRPVIRYFAEANGSHFAANEDHLYRSTDGATTWSRVLTIPAPVFITALFGERGDTLLMGARAGLYRSTNAGQQWSMIVAAEHEELVDVVTRTGAGTLLIGVNYLSIDLWRGSLHRSIDNGTTWTPSDDGLSGLIQDLSEAPDGTLYLASDGSPTSSGGLFRSTDDGLTWQRVVGLSSTNVRGIAALSADVLLAATSVSATFNRLQRSTDAGNTWEEVPSLPLISDFDETADGSAYAYGGFPPCQGLFRSVNAGEAWTPFEDGLETRCLTRVILDGDDFLLAGARNGLYRTVGPTTVVEGPPAIARLALAPPRPNPVVGTSAFNYWIPVRTHVLLTVFDVLGRQVATLVSGHQERGFHTVSMSRSGLRPGIYIARLSAAAGVISRQFALGR